MTSTVNISRRPVSIRNDSTHFPASEIWAYAPPFWEMAASRPELLTQANAEKYASLNEAPQG